MPRKTQKRSDPRIGKQERYIQPSILLGLRTCPSYGYELIQTIQRFGFIEGNAPPGMIYRHLRQLEEDGLVTSEWKTEGSGPAKRVYSLTEEGREMLSIWIDYLQRQAENLDRLIRHYHQIEGERK